MRLTSLEIKGFKSFADKTTIHFNESITGVVGPNGSGKSNVVDAIRWVIGEQRTSSLRSEKMSNLIFNGSRNRKQAGMAEVSLSFTNDRNLIASEFANITVTRILHRDGESEYRINDVNCRLKDITNLFLDTGISSDSYAIIELKMIDEILHDRENSRRRLFEQAAGISKFKQRKKETLSKLQATDGDLARVDDLLFEITNNLKSLEAQAKKTKRFYEIKEKYKEQSIELARHSLIESKASFDQLEAQRKEEHNKKLEIEVRLRQLEKELEEGKTAIIDQEKHLSTRQKELNELLANINKKESDHNFARQQKVFLTERLAGLQQQVTSSGQQLTELTTKQADLQTRKATQDQVVIDTKAELETLGKQLTDNQTQNSGVKAELDKVVAQKANLEKSLYQLEKDIAINNSQKEALERSMEQNKTENKDREESLVVVKKELEDLMAQRTTQHDNLTKLQKAEEELKRQTSDNSRFVDEARQLLAKENRVLDQKNNEYNLNKSLVDNLEGFPDSIKFLKKTNKALVDAPLLSDVIYCKDEYRVAVENYLEPFLNYIVVGTLEEANTNINLLSKSNKGRINFFVLEDFKKVEAAPVMMTQAKCATEVIEVDAKYQKLAAFLLDHVYILPENELEESDADNILKKHKVTLLSKSGKFIRTKYSLSGGSVGLFEGMRIGRTKNLEKLKVEIEEIEVRRKEIEKQLKQLEADTAKLQGATKAKEIVQEQQAINQLDSRIANLQAKVENYQAFINQFQLKNSDIEERIMGLDSTNKDQQNKAKELQAEKAKVDEAHVELLRSFTDAGKFLAEASNKYNEKNIFFHQQQNHLNSLAQEITYAESRIAEITKQTEQNRSEIEGGTKKQEENDAKLATLDTELAQLKTDKDTFEKNLSDVEATYYKARGEINTAEERIKNWQKQQTQVLEILESIKDKHTELRISQSGLKERLSVEFAIDIDTITGEPDTTLITREQLQAEVEKIRNRVEHFGEINPMAVEAFDEMQKRHVFISDQKNDLVKAKEALTATMNEIEGSAKDKFMDAFTQVRTNFQEVFRSLFTEDDTCDLILLDESNPLESDIDIIAKPKGKKPQVIDQLSGGEKTLTALALLFSLYLLKPAPFCILDEVDAPLDDANIGKFNGAIRQFSKDSQFIMVTHNKSTMSAVDVIYGVTMHEPGVSKVVPVDFRSLN